MKLQHHLGGLEGLDPVRMEKRVFVQHWERRIFAIHVAMMGLSRHLSEALPKYAMDRVPTAFKSVWTWADLRKGAEAMNPFDYFRLRYYEKWLGGITRFFVEQGYLTQGELDARTRAYLTRAHAPLPRGGEGAIDDQIIDYLRRGDSPRRQSGQAPKFSAGEHVRVKNVPPGEHTRLPGYLRGKAGLVEGVFEEAYSYACSTGPDGLGTPMSVYSVRFDPGEIWGDLSEARSWVYADLYEAYLETDG